MRTELSLIKREILCKSTVDHYGYDDLGDITDDRPSKF